MFFEQKNKLIK